MGNTGRKNIVMSWDKLLYKKIKKVNTTTGTKIIHPVKIYKHSQQFIYNNGKNGVENKAKNVNKVCHTSNIRFKRIYLFRKLDAVILNVWKVVQ